MLQNWAIMLEKASSSVYPGHCRCCLKFVQLKKNWKKKRKVSDVYSSKIIQSIQHALTQWTRLLVTLFPKHSTLTVVNHQEKALYRFSRIVFLWKSWKSFIIPYDCQLWRRQLVLMTFFSFPGGVLQSIVSHLHYNGRTATCFVSAFIESDL